MAPSTGREGATPGLGRRAGGCLVGGVDLDSFGCLGVFLVRLEGVDWLEFIDR